MSVPLAYILFLSFGVFCFGAAGFLIRRNILSMLMCLELMLSAVNMAFVAFARFHVSESGHILYFLVITVAACESAIGIALTLNFYRLKQNIWIEEARELKG
jgi:NADH-quinone oxidoreductase subunit K